MRDMCEILESREMRDEGKGRDDSDESDGRHVIRYRGNEKRDEEETRNEVDEDEKAQKEKQVHEDEW